MIAFLVFLVGLIVFAYGLGYMTASTERTCMVPPPGWECTREAGHEGPCACWPTSGMSQ